MKKIYSRGYRRIRLLNIYFFFLFSRFPRRETFGTFKIQQVEPALLLPAYIKKKKSTLPISVVYIKVRNVPGANRRVSPRVLSVNIYFCIVFSFSSRSAV